MKKNFSKKTLIILISISVVKKIALILTALFCSGAIFSQATLRGKVFDAQTKQPIEFANITIKGQISGFLGGAVTNEKGLFAVENLPKDTFVLTVFFTGYDNFEQKIFIGNSQKIIELKPFFLNAAAQVLQEVVAEGMRSQMRFELDKKVFDVASSAITDGASASDILQDIPSVEVSADGAVSLRGSESVTIWINGKPSGLNTDNQAQILEQLPANSIERVEIITNPSAKYSPEGTAGIINIVLKENSKEGYYGSVQASGNSRLGYDASANINYSNKKIEAFGSAGFRSRAMQGGGYAYQKRFDENNDTIGFLNSDNISKGRGNNIFTRLGVTWHATSKDHLSISAFGMFGKNNNSTDVTNTSDMPIFPSKSLRNTLQQNTMFGGNATLGYKHDFSKTQYLDFTASYNIWSMDGNSNFNQTNYFFRGIDTLKTNSFQNQTTESRNQVLDFKLDYSNQFNENHKVEAGYQGTFVDSRSPQETFSGADKSTLIITPEFCNNLLYNQNVNALYAAYSGKYKNFNFQAGMRGEITNTVIRSLEYGQTAANAAPFDTTYFSAFPSVFLSYNLPKDNQIQVNYTRRITRPNGWRLNPFKNISDSTNIQFGNPYLMPEFSNAFELNYIKTWEKHIFSLSGYFRNTDNVMQRISFLQDNQRYSTFTNVSQTISSGTELVLKDKFFKFLNLTTTVNLFYYYLKGFEYLPQNADRTVVGDHQSNFSWNFRMIAQAMLPKGFMLQLTGGYSAPQAVAQGQAKGSYFVDGGLRKSLGNFSFNLNARDIFNSRSRNSITYGEGFVLDSKNWRGGRTITLSVAYSFGNLKPDIKKRNQNQENSDESSMDSEMEF
ncbi:MAG: TonB-dependent receptor [Prevotellaceae bacterium]|jgi:outer membrane receptor protein involved in Fe transport|nr:TonB-dependent receptor [Prevotellaceae bacterium]